MSHIRTIQMFISCEILVLNFNLCNIKYFAYTITNMFAHLFVSIVSFHLDMESKCGQLQWIGSSYTAQF